MKHENHMIKIVLGAVVLALILAFSAIAFAQSFSATCPYDGEFAQLTHTVGFGQQRICWYSHLHMESNLRTVRHTFYESCPTQ